MNIKAIFVAASALILSATAVSAQNTTKTQSGKSAKESTCVMKKGDKDQKGACLFDNLNLTDAQKAKIKALKENEKKARTENKEKARAERSNARKDYLANLKTILTPEQYVQFLENNYLNAGKQGHKGGMDMKRGDRKGGRDGKGMPRGDRKGAPAAAAKADKK